MTSKEWVSVEELAKLLATTTRGVYMRRSRGQLPPDAGRIGVYVVWNRDTIQTWMKTRGAEIRRANLAHAERR